MRLQMLALSLYAIGLASCDSRSEKTTISDMTASEVQALEARAVAGDREALRDLDIHYGMEMMEVDRTRIHRKRLLLNDPESIAEELDRTLRQAAKASDCSARRVALSDSQNLIVRLEGQGIQTDRTRYDRLEAAKRSIEDVCR